MRISGAGIVEAITGGLKKLLSSPPQRPTAALEATVGTVGIRIGMWAYSASRQHVGVITGVSVDGLVEFHLVTPDRLTASVCHVPVSDLRQARRSEIPATSRPDAIKGERMGYL